MKKFLFTLAALLMATAAFAQTDAKYLYVSGEAPDPDIENGIILTVSCEIPAYMSAFEAQINVPQGLTVTYLEMGPDGIITYKDTRGRTQTLTPAISTSGGIMDHFIIALTTAGFWQDPNGENPNAWVSYGAVKWDPGEYEEFMYVYCEYDETYHGGNVSITTNPSSGKDTRGDTVTEVGDKNVPHTTDAVEPLEDPQPAGPEAVAAPEINTSMDDDNVYVTITWPTTDGEKMYDGQYTYARPEYGQPDQSYNVEAYTTATEAYQESIHATAVIEVPAKEPVWQPVAAPEISTSMDDNNVYVTITWPTTDGEKMYDGQYTYARPEYGQPDESYTVEAYTAASYPYEESAHAVATIEVPAKEPVWQPVAAPVITYTVGEETVTVTIEWPTTTGNQVYTGEYTYNRPAPGEETDMYDVEAYTEADYPYEESAHAFLTIFVPPMVQEQTPAPEITYEDNGEGILVTATGNGTITLLVEDEVVATGDGTASYLLPYCEDPEGEMVTVSATAQAPDEAISDYAVEEIFVPYKPAPQPEPVAAPVIETSMDEDYVYVTITWPTTDGEHYYNGEYSYPRTDADYSVDVEAYTGATNNYLESDHATKTIDVPAKEPVVMKTFVKVTDASELEVGKKYIFVCGDYAMGEIVNGFGSQVEVVRGRAADEVKVPAKIALTLGGETGAYTLQFTNDMYLVAGNSTGLNEGDNPTQWVITDNNGALDGLRAKHADYNRAIKMHNSLPRFGNYSINDTNSEYAFIYKEKEDEVVLDPTLAPGVQTWTGVWGDHTQYVQFDESEDNCEIEYRVKFEDGEWSDWMPYDEVLTFTENGTYDVEGRAKADGKDWSDATGVHFVITERTGIDEVSGDKAVAGVRYFNLAGQEMAQPEGMTIIVTTYTDGTTSAVKVMK